MWSAAVALLLQGYMCLCLEVALCRTWLQPMVLNYCYLSIMSNPNFPLTSGINKDFLSTQQALTGQFLCFRPRDCCKNPGRTAVSEILRAACLAPITMARSKSLKSHSFPNLTLSLNFIKLFQNHVWMPACIKLLFWVWLITIFVLTSDITGVYICYIHDICIHVTV